MGDILEMLEGHMTKKGSDFQFSDEKYIGLYFSAHWCPPCRQFTPKLAEYYNNVQAKGHRFEVVFLSSDRDEDSFNEYYNEMPWAALKFNDREIKNKIAEIYSVRGIPTLVILDRAGQTVSANARSNVMNKTGLEDNLTWS